MRVPRRFTLSSLLLIVTATAVLLGYTQWRRQWLKNAVAEFNKAHGTDLVMSQTLFWPKATPRKVTLTFTQNIGGQLVRGGKEYSYSEINSAANRLMAMGVDEVVFDLNRENGEHIYYEQIPFGVW
jgi:hypothetical protein